MCLASVPNKSIGISAVHLGLLVKQVVGFSRKFFETCNLHDIFSFPIIAPVIYELSRELILGIIACQDQIN